MLTVRELEVLKLAKKLTQKEISKKLKISQPAVSKFYTNALKKIADAKASKTLTNREVEVLKLSEKQTQKQIAKKLKISQPAVSKFYNNAIKKIDDAKEVIALAIKLKI